MKKAILFSLILFFVIGCNKDDDEGGASSGAHIITTKAIINITGNSAISGGNITIGGNATISTRGVCWGTQKTPTIANFTTNDGNGGGEFDSNITNLNPNTTYYVRAYATDSNGGTSYGNEVQFTTIETDKVYTGDITLKTQAEVENFGSMGYTSVTGKLCIGCGGHNNIFDLSPLSTLTAVKTLSTENNIVLIKLNGLENLIELDNLFIKQNPLLENLDIFSGITDINTVELDDNSSLTDIDGLNNLTAIREHIKISNTKAITLNLENITTLGGLECLNSRFKTITIGSGAPKVGGLTIKDCQSLTELNVSNIEEMDHFILERNNNLNNLNFENLVKTNGNFSISSNQGLSAFNIPHIEEVGDFIFSNNNNLNNLNLESLVEVNDTFSIVGNQALILMNVDNLTSLKTLNIQGTYLVNVNFESLQSSSVPISITIRTNQNLTNISLNNVTKAFSVEFFWNQVLQNIQWGGLTTVEDKFEITDCDRLTSITLNNLIQLKGYSKIERNLILETFEANNLTKAEDVFIRDNVRLTSVRLPNLSNLRSLLLYNTRVSDLSLEGLQNRAEPTSLFIEQNPYLLTTNFGAMTIAKDVRFEYNDNLRNFSISNLSKIESSLYVINCDNIREINIDNLTEFNGDLKIGGNDRLDVFKANNITEMGEFSITGYSISSISMQNLRVVNKSFTIDATNITNLDNFSMLNSVTTDFYFRSNHSLSDFCGVTNLITNGFVGNYIVYNNMYNPTQQDIIDGNCSL